MRLYRVLPYLVSAADNEPGGVFFRPPGGKNCADSPPPERYRCLYVSDSPSGAIAETFGRFDEWDRALFETVPASPALPGSYFALATYELDMPGETCNLNDARALQLRSLRPSDVVTRKRATTQAWAAHIFEEAHYDGVGWWSYYDADWRSIALWDIEHLTAAVVPRRLRADDADIRAAADTIVRRLTI